MLGTFPTFDGLAVYTGSDACTIDSNSYTINSILSAVTLALDGTLTVSTAAAVP